MKRLLGALLLALAFILTSTAAMAVIDINTADTTELEQLKGIGPVKAKAIVDFRNANGPFATVEDLMQVAGIGPKSIIKLRDQATAGGARKPATRIR